MSSWAPGRSSSSGRGAAYLLPAPADDWDAVFGAALAELKDAFWAESFKVAPVETAAAVGSALVAVLSATDPARDLEVTEHRGLGGAAAAASRGSRAARAGARRTVAAGARGDPGTAGRGSRAMRCVALRVIFVEGVPALTRWQRALIEKLNRDAGECAAGRGARQAFSRRCWRSDGAVRRRARSACCRRGCIGRATDKAPLDESVQWLGVRDFLQEAEVAAGMVQRLLAEDSKLKPADIGLLLPDEFEYAVAVEDAFRLGGLALSGLPAERWRRDLGREAVFHFLYCRQKPAPAMALAVCLSSPLMPWSREQGAVLAQAVMDGDYELEAAEECECGDAGDARAAARGGQRARDA